MPYPCIHKKAFKNCDTFEHFNSDFFLPQMSTEAFKLQNFVGTCARPVVGFLIV